MTIDLAGLLDAPVYDTWGAAAVLTAVDKAALPITVLFSMGRLPGWIAHWREMNEQGLRIGRPRQIYIGANERSMVPIDQR